MNIALIGTRGVPASYSGFETCVENLGARLVQRGHTVTVYNRRHHSVFEGHTYRGMRLVWVRGIATKHLDTISHTALSMAHAVTQRYDAIAVFIAGNAPLCAIPRALTRARILLNVDGLDWKREKWGALARRYLQWTERLSPRLAHVVITDSREVQRYYAEDYGQRTAFIPYGADVTRRPPGAMLARYGLTPGQYVLFVGRLVPENCAHHLVDAWRALPIGLRANRKCVIVGDAPYSDDYIADLKARAAGDPSIIFTGYQFGEAYEELSSHALAFVETSQVGGTHPALIEAMGFGSCVVANATPENLEALGGTGLNYAGARGGAALMPVLAELLKDPTLPARLAVASRARADAVYSWEAVTDAYERLMAGGDASKP